jgi:hypothetical protein
VLPVSFLRPTTNQKCLLGRYFLVKAHTAYRVAEGKSNVNRNENKKLRASQRI